MNGMDGEEVPGFTADYIQYTKEEWNDLITQELQKQTLEQLDQNIEAVRANKIAESKLLLEQYYADNPLLSDVHDPDGEYYSVTSEKQAYLMQVIALCDQAEKMGIEFEPTWNATGKVCEPWTPEELRVLSMQIAAFVYPAVSEQQHYEKLIADMDDVQEIQELEIIYGNLD